MNIITRDPLQYAVCGARERTLAWLDDITVDRAPLVSRYSSAHEVAAWPGLTLPGTYNAICCRALIGGLSAGAEARADAIAWLEVHRLRNGRFRIPGMTDDTVYKRPDSAETWQYIDFHVTNYALGAIEMLDDTHTPNLVFVRPYLDTAAIDEWLTRRDWRDPWQEGNNLVNLASFLDLATRFGAPPERTRAAAALAHLFVRLEALQNPATSFWGVGQEAGGETLLHAMAGAMHPFHLWYLKDRPLPHHAKAVDYTLTLPAGDIMGACLDVDAVDVIFHGLGRTPLSRADAEPFLRAKLAAILAVQNADGGFPDLLDGTLRFDGWVGGYREPQGVSNTFATWFRWIAIAMIAEVLWPGWRAWRFRRMIGIGFAKKAGATPHD